MVKKFWKPKKDPDCDWSRSTHRTSSSFKDGNPKTAPTSLTLKKHPKIERGYEPKETKR